jgi:hypothetical protein
MNPVWLAKTILYKEAIGMLKIGTVENFSRLHIAIEKVIAYRNDDLLREGSHFFYAFVQKSVVIAGKIDYSGDIMFHKVLLTLFTVPLLFSAINSENDFQIWVDEVNVGKIRDDLSLISQLELRFGDDASKLYLFFGQVGCMYSPKDWLSVTLWYRQMTTRIGETDNWQALYVPLADLTFSWKKNDWKLSNRNRYMYFMKDPDHHPNSSLYRNLTTLVMPGSPSGRVHPYISEEIFVLQRRGLSQSRTQAGFITGFPKTFSLATYYMLKYDKKADGNWKHQNVLGFNAKFSF